MSPRPNLTEVRRRQILEAAADVIVERGAGEIRVADIAEKVGISPPLVMYYFDTKDEILSKALAFKDREFFDSVARAAGDDPPIRRLEALIDASCPGPEAPSDDASWVLWMEAWARSRHDPAVAEMRHRMDANWRNVVSDTVRQGQAVGAFDPAVDADRFARALTGLIDGLAIQVVLGDEDVDRGEMRDICMEFASRHLARPLGGKS